VFKESISEVVHPVRINRVGKRDMVGIEWNWILKACTGYLISQGIGALHTFYSRSYADPR